jgi:S-adenosylmethionine:tRNA ribosyltransferase-isomerase
MKVSDFDFHLPDSFIALRPAVPRDSCRLLVLHGDGSVEHKRFYDLADYLGAGDLLLLNNTKVFPARLHGRKETGGKMDFLLVREIEGGFWEILARDRYTGRVSISENLFANMLGGKTVEFQIQDTGRRSQVGPETADKPERADERRIIFEALWDMGMMPLPPYIKRKPDDADKLTYQTVYAETVGSIAAPTAGLHFTQGLLDNIAEKGAIIRHLTLHVGTGTFKPVRAENVEDHIMDSERFELDRSVIETIEEVKNSGKRIVSVGTTTTRAVEGFFGGSYQEIARNEQGGICGSTDIFIYPGYEFGVVDSLVTNFHLPASTPLMLASALCGKENLMSAYKQAVSIGYRFFSYGDAMLIL